MEVESHCRNVKEMDVLSDHDKFETCLLVASTYISHLMRTLETTATHTLQVAQENVTDGSHARAAIYEYVAPPTSVRRSSAARLSRNACRFQRHPVSMDFLHPVKVNRAIFSIPNTSLLLVAKRQRQSSEIFWAKWVSYSSTAVLSEQLHQNSFLSIASDTFTFRCRSGRCVLDSTWVWLPARAHRSRCLEDQSSSVVDAPWTTPCTSVCSNCNTRP